MYTPAWRRAWDLQGIQPAAKYVLLALVRHRCDTCGLAWPGMRHLRQSTLLSESTIRVALKDLLKAVDREAPDLKVLKIHAYPQGGRGRATQYLVLPGLTELSTAPCPRCDAFLRNPPKSGGFKG